MHILAFDAGSATLEFGRFDAASATPLMESTLVTGARSGDLDPGIPGFVARTLAMDLAQVEAALYHDSGLKVLSGVGSDLREIEARARQGHEGARAALQIHAYGVRKYIGACSAAMGGCDAVAFTGGAGENSPALRRRVLKGLEFLGVLLFRRMRHAVKESKQRLDGVPDGHSVCSSIEGPDRSKRALSASAAAGGRAPDPPGR